MLVDELQRRTNPEIIILPYSILLCVPSSFFKTV